MPSLSTLSWGQTAFCLSLNWPEKMAKEYLSLSKPQIPPLRSSRTENVTTKLSIK